ncbi:MAG: hypothetical protein AB1673_08965 [Actinomycetota bacterium]
MTARLLVIMGSGETSPTMSKLHRELFARLGGPASVPAVMLDTPFGFQENADDIAAKAEDYFRKAVGRPVSLASYRSADQVGSVAHEAALVKLGEARWVFAGPGSPSHALRLWKASRVPALLADKLRDGGCITFASAAAVTLGPFALPVYEIYKVGQEPFWLEGLDLTGRVGLPAVVVPHWNNAEGGHHDTRYCYMGERRLRVLEDKLPEGIFVLGVDEHTACVLDLDEGTATVSGLGGVTIRAAGAVVRRVEAGETVATCDLAHGVGGGGGPARVSADAAQPGAGHGPAARPARSPLLASVTELEARFAQALEARDADAATACALDLVSLLDAWSSDTTESDELDRARAALRSMVVRLGQAASTGLRDPRAAVAPFVEALLDARRQARDDRRWADADSLRDRLLAAGIEVRDGPEGTEWQVVSSPQAPIV